MIEFASAVVLFICSLSLLFAAASLALMMLDDVSGGRFGDKLRRWFDER